MGAPAIPNTPLEMMDMMFKWAVSCATKNSEAMKANLEANLAKTEDSKAKQTAYSGGLFIGFSNALMGVRMEPSEFIGSDAAAEEDLILLGELDGIQIVKSLNEKQLAILLIGARAASLAAAKEGS